MDFSLTNPKFIKAVQEGKSRSQGGLNVNPDLMSYAKHYGFIRGNERPRKADLIARLKSLLHGASRAPARKAPARKAPARKAPARKPSSHHPRLKFHKPSKFHATVDKCLARFTELDDIIITVVEKGKIAYGEDYVSIAQMLKRMLITKNPGQLSIYESSKGRIRRCIKTVKTSNLKAAEKQHLLKILNKLNKLITMVVEGSDSDGGSAMFDLITQSVPQYILNMPDAPGVHLHDMPDAPGIVPQSILNMPDAPVPAGAGGTGAGARSRVLVQVHK